MARWEPNAPERLITAALELFAEQGYDDTTVAQIAERAGLTKSTFFRHFPDKREVLFVGQDALSGLLADGIAQAPEPATPLEAVAAGLAAASAGFPPERREFAAVRQRVVAAHPELQEREALKKAGLQATMIAALRARGIAEPTADLAATLGSLAFSAAFARWIEPGEQSPFGELALDALHELQTASAALT